MSKEIDLFVAEMNKKYGDGVVISGEQVRQRKPRIIPWSPSLDLITGGIPEGSWVSVSGPEKAGKGVSVLTFCANAQRPENGSKFILYLDAEGRFKSFNFQIDGLQTTPDRFQLVTSSPEKILNGNDFLEIGTNALMSIPNLVLVIDSVSCLPEEKEMAEGMGSQSRGGSAKSLSQFCRINSNVVPVRGAIVIGIVRMIHNTSGYGPAMNEKAGSQWQYQGDVQLQIKKKVPLTVGTTNPRVVGIENEWYCKTAATGVIPYQKVTSYIRFGIGIDKVHEAAVLGVSVGLISKKGAWFSLDFMEGHLDVLGVESWKSDGERLCRVQGEANLAELLRSKPAWLEVLELQLRSLTGVGGFNADS